MSKISGQLLISGNFRTSVKFQEFQDNWEPCYTTCKDLKTTGIRV